MLPTLVLFIIYFACFFFFKSVVVVEEIQHLKCQLESDVSSSETILSALKVLGSKNVSKDVLLSTKIGHTVNQLRRQGSTDEIKEQAKLVFRRWRGFIRDLEKEKPLIEVRCDKKTEVIRGKARQLLAHALQTTVWLLCSHTQKMFFWHRLCLNYTNKNKKVGLGIDQLRHHLSTSRLSYGSVTKALYTRAQLL